MKLTNKYRANCWDCGRPILPGQGVLIGKDTVVGWWMTRCLICDKNRVVVPGFFDGEIDDDEETVSINEIGGDHRNASCN